MPPRRLRLDAELVRRGLARSREHASELIAAGRVSVNKAVATKPATGVTTDADLVVREDPDEPRLRQPWRAQARGSARGLHPARPAGRGPAVPGRRSIDGRVHRRAAAGGGGEVVAVDVGYGQLVWALQQDPRVRVHDRTNIREIDTDLIGGPVDLVVGDLSFISLELVLDALIGVTASDGDLVLMVKPQFEVGKERLGKGGVVRDLGHRADAVDAVAEAAARRGWGARAVDDEPAAGPVGQRGVLLVAACRGARDRRGTRSRPRWPVPRPWGCRVRR